MRKNTVEKKLFFVICLIFSVFCFSCNNVLFQDINSINQNPDLQNADFDRAVKYGKISGEVTFNGALPQELLKIAGLDAGLKNSSKTAFPSMTNLTENPDNYEYKVFAKKVSDSSAISTGIYNKTEQSFEIQNIPQNVEFQVIVQLVQSGGIDPILEGVSKKVTITESNPVMSLSGDDRIKLVPVAQGSGTVDLNIEIEAGMAPQVQYVTVVSSGASFSAAVQNNATNVEIKNTETSIPAGAYDITVNFYNNPSDCVLLYSYSDVINVYNSFTTDTWTLNNDVSGLLYEDFSGASSVVKAKLTKSLLEQFLKTTFYVSSSGLDGANGSYYDPCQSIKKALDIIKGYNQQNQNYRIYVKAGYTEDVTSPLNFTNFNCTMEPYSNAIGDRLGTITLNATNTEQIYDEQVIYVENGNFSFYNLKIDGKNIQFAGNANPVLINVNNFNGATKLTLTDCELYNATSSALKINQNNRAALFGCSIHDCSTIGQGGGIFADENSECTLTDCNIYNNTANMNGGGICSKGSLVFDGECVIGNKTVSSTATSDTHSNYTKENGGGIYSLNGTITVKPGAKLYVCGNYAEYDGGGIYIETNTDFSMNDAVCSYNGANINAGGIYLKTTASSKKINFDFVSIKNCKAGQNGGGLYIKMNNTSSGYATTLNKSIVSDCSAQEDGGGVYIEKGAVVLTDTQVYSCSAFINGGGVFAGSWLYVRDGSAIGINKDGVDYQNSAGENGKGNGVYVAYSTTPSCEGKLYLNGTGYVYSKNDVYLCDKNGTSVKLICESDLNPASPDKISAMITPQTYAADKEVLQKESTATESYRKNSYIYFKITREESTDWSLDESGKLLPLFYVSATGEDEPNRGKEANPYKTLSYAIAQHNDASKIKFIVNGHIYDSDITVGLGKTYLIEGANFDNAKDIIDGNATNRIINNYGTLFLTGITLQNGKNYGTGLLCSYAGGITNAGTCMLDCCRIIDCESTGDIQYGGAIYSDTTGGKLTLKNCIIGQERHPNKAAQGAGIYLHSPVEFIGKNYICYNEATAGDAEPYYAGGGIFYNMDGITSDQELKDVEISNNAGVNGAGICVTGGSSQIKITDCVIKDNIGQTDKDYAGTPLSLCGSGVYVDGNVSLAGKNYLASNNDIYVKSGKPVTITGPLDLPQEAGGVAGVITPEDYTQQVLSGSGLVTNDFYLFKITDDSEHYKYRTMTEGYLLKEIDFNTSAIDTLTYNTKTFIKLHGNLNNSQFTTLKAKIEVLSSNSSDNYVSIDFSDTTSDDIEEMSFYRKTDYENTRIVEVIFPAYVKKINFNGKFNKLEKVSFAPAAILETLTKNCFNKCTNIRFVDLPDSCTTIESEAFTGGNPGSDYSCSFKVPFLRGRWEVQLTDGYTGNTTIENISFYSYLKDRNYTKSQYAGNLYTQTSKFTVIKKSN